MRSNQFLRLVAISLLSVSAGWAADAIPTPHAVIKCAINGDAKNALIFAYDQKGAMGEGLASRPGYCKLTADANGDPFGS